MHYIDSQYLSNVTKNVYCKWQHNAAQLFSTLILINVYILYCYIFPIYVLLIAEEKEKANIVAPNASFVTCVKASMLKSVLRRQA